MELTFGEYLRKERETREISLDDVAKATKIQKRLLIALEDNRLDQLPALTFVRGFIRLYAQFIGLDPKQAVLRFEEYLKQIHPEPGVEKPELKKPLATKNIVISAVVLLLVVAVVVLSVIGSRGQRERATPPAQPARPSPLAETPAAPRVPTYLSAPYEVKIKAVEICWLLATIDEKAGREAMLYPGDSVIMQAEKRMSLLLGNAGGAQVSVNSALLKSVGAHWKPARLLIPEDLPQYLPQGYQLRTEEKPAEQKPAETTTAPAGAPKP